LPSKGKEEIKELQSKGKEVLQIERNYPRQKIIKMKE
jgi:hypothetical protein